MITSEAETESKEVTELKQKYDDAVKEMNGALQRLNSLKTEKDELCDVINEKNALLQQAQDLNRKMKENFDVEIESLSEEKEKLKSKLVANFQRQRNYDSSFRQFDEKMMNLEGCLGLLLSMHLKLY